ncbi:uncharacterized protein LOC144864332 [Branchiostoma floridae x Branchiostoma japonicum]
MKVLCAIFLGSTLLLTVSSAAVSDEIMADEAENADASLLQLLKDVIADSSTQQGDSDEVENILDDLREITEENGLDLEEPDLEEPDLEEPDLEEPDLEEPDLEGTDLEEPDLEGTEDAAETPLEVADDELNTTKGCQGHQVGDQWGTPEHDNCICQGSDRLCYHVDCLSGSVPVSDSNGPWSCDAGLSKKDITGSDLVMWNGEKRGLPFAIGAAAVGGAAVVGFAGYLGAVTTVGFILDRVEHAKTMAQLNAIQNKLHVLDAKLDKLTQAVRDLQLGQYYLHQGQQQLLLGQQYLHQATLYGRDELRLLNMIDTVSKMQVSDGHYTGVYNPEGWADHVLSYGSDGVQQVLHNLLNMVKPRSLLFGGKSVFEIFHEQLKGDIPKYREKMPKKVTQVYSLLGGGYAVWITALRIKGRTGEIPAKKSEAERALASLAPGLLKYFVYGACDCPTGWQPHARKCYKVYTITKTWPGASAHCRNKGRGGMLAMAKDSGTNGFLINLKNKASRKAYFWFGLNDRASEGRWKWSDGSSLRYRHWGRGEPNNAGNEDCAEFRGSIWNDVPCYRKQFFICERNTYGL